MSETIGTMNTVLQLGSHKATLHQSTHSVNRRATQAHVRSGLAAAMTRVVNLRRRISVSNRRTRTQAGTLEVGPVRWRYPVSMLLGVDHGLSWPTTSSSGFTAGPLSSSLDTRLSLSYHELKSAVWVKKATIVFLPGVGSHALRRSISSPLDALFTKTPRSNCRLVSTLFSMTRIIKSTGLPCCRRGGGRDQESRKRLPGPKTLQPRKSRTNMQLYLEYVHAAISSTL